MTKEEIKAEKARIKQKEKDAKKEAKGKLKDKSNWFYRRNIDGQTLIKDPLKNTWVLENKLTSEQHTRLNEAKHQKKYFNYEEYFPEKTEAVNKWNNFADNTVKTLGDTGLKIAKIATDSDTAENIANQITASNAAQRQLASANRQALIAENSAAEQGAYKQRAAQIANRSAEQVSEQDAAQKAAASARAQIGNGAARAMGGGAASLQASTTAAKNADTTATLESNRSRSDTQAQQAQSIATQQASQRSGAEAARATGMQTAYETQLNTEQNAKANALSKGFLNALTDKHTTAYENWTNNRDAVANLRTAAGSDYNSVVNWIQTNPDNDVVNKFVTNAQNGSGQYDSAARQVVAEYTKSLNNNANTAEQQPTETQQTATEQVQG